MRVSSGQSKACRHRVGINNGWRSVQRGNIIGDVPAVVRGRRRATTTSCSSRRATTVLHIGRNATAIHPNHPGWAAITSIHGVHVDVGVAGVSLIINRTAVGIVPIRDDQAVKQVVVPKKGRVRTRQLTLSLFVDSAPQPGPETRAQPILRLRHKEKEAGRNTKEAKHTADNRAAANRRRHCDHVVAPSQEADHVRKPGQQSLQAQLGRHVRAVIEA